MRLVHVLLPLQVVLVSLVATGTLTANGEQPSTVFVLDTSDSDSAPVGGGGNNQHNSAAEPAADASTRIVSDEQAGGHNQRKQSNQTNHQRAATVAPASSAHSQHEKHGPGAAGSSTQSSHEHGQAPVTSRRLDEPAYLAPAHAASSHQQHASGQQGASQAQRKQTTTASPYESEQNSSVPKSEERLLISITSEDLDEPYKKVVSASSNQGYEETHTPSGPAGQQVHHHQKRKPAITISIQDANLNKQTGGAGTQAVIVRPGEDGQSIVIATVGAASVSNTNGNNKYKPAQAGAGDSIPSQQQRPYQEPANNPIQAIVAQHLVTSTTRRPPAGDYNSQPPANQNRPVASTLTDERPQRPVLGGLDERPNQAHVRPTQEPYSPNGGGGGGGHSGNQDAANEPPSSYDHSQGAATGEDQRKYPLSEKNCGVMHETRIVGGDVADPDDFMWMAAIIKSKPNNGEPRPFCGGSLITRRHILTAAHCLEGLAPRDVLVRLGSYDFEDSASSSSADYAIDQFRVPAQYSRKTHVADLAIMRLKTPLSPNDQYKTVCMPQPRRSYVGAYGLVTGYGSQSQTFRKAAPKLRQVTVPIWENRECSKVYNKTMGDSFLCAGYEAGGKDACQGDSGGPIMTEGPGQKMMIVGVVSHGIGCGSPGYPGVYTRTTTFADWIEKNTKE